MKLWLVLTLLFLAGCQTVAPKPYTGFADLLRDCGKSEWEAMLMESYLEAAKKAYLTDLEKYEATQPQLSGPPTPAQMAAVLQIALESGIPQQMEALKRECPQQMAAQEKAYNASRPAGLP